MTKTKLTQDTLMASVLKYRQHGLIVACLKMQIDKLPIGDKMDIIDIIERLKRAEVAE